MYVLSVCMSVSMNRASEIGCSACFGFLFVCIVRMW